MDTACARTPSVVHLASRCEGRTGSGRGGAVRSSPLRSPLDRARRRRLRSSTGPLGRRVRAIRATAEASRGCARRSPWPGRRRVRRLAVVGLVAAHPVPPLLVSKSMLVARDVRSHGLLAGWNLTVEPYRRLWRHARLRLSGCPHARSDDVRSSQALPSRVTTTETSQGGRK
jgi:hypothetical protein